MLINGLLAVVVADLCEFCHERLESRPGGCQARLRWVSGEWAWFNREHDERGRDGRIYWYDPRSRTWWRFKAFLDGGKKAWTV